ncbi:ribonuclease P protein subunit p40 [Trichomycterus rosablanca]|uniref:ribonuclease P protein subunit p40 n=1 Tax=Trichomycterus rosablanca TaxID=2290929 RepID=UPI002F3534AF
MSLHLETCPKHLLVWEKCNFLNKESRHEVHVFEHSFNCKLSLLIPECGALPAELAKVINNFSSYYLVRDVPVYKFLEDEMFRNGGFYALSFNTRIDEDNCVALLPSGKLILSLDKDTYEQLGLEGKPSLYNHRKVMRYVVTLDLTQKSLAPGTKRYQQTLSSLKERVPLRCDFLVSTSRSGQDQDAPLQGFLSPFVFEKHRPTLNIQNLNNLLCPSLHSTDLQGTRLSCTPIDFLEWLGTVSLNISCENSAASFLSTYVCPEPCSSVSQGLLCTVTGLILPEDIHALLQIIRQSFDDHQFTTWLSLTVHGFADSPVSWKSAEHGFLKGGENFYNLVCFKNQDYWLYMCSGSQYTNPP